MRKFFKFLFTVAFFISMLFIVARLDLVINACLSGNWKTSAFLTELFRIEGLKFWAEKSVPAVVKTGIDSEFVEIQIPEEYSFLTNWTVAECTFYDPNDSKQTRPNTDGTGAFKRKIEPSSVSFGSVLTQEFKIKGLRVHIEVESFDSEKEQFRVTTRHGENTFTIDDNKNKYYRRAGEYFIDFHFGVVKPYYYKRGKFPMRFRIVKVEKYKKSG